MSYVQARPSYPEGGGYGVSIDTVILPNAPIHYANTAYIVLRDRDQRYRMTARMPPIEKTDYPALDMGHSFSRTDISIVGLEVQVYGLEEIKKSNKPIVGLVRFLTIPS